MNISLKLCAAALCCGIAGVAQAQGYSPCGELANAFGPYDYRKASQSTRELVEGSHFTPRVERLIGGSRASTAGGDIDYTLRAFPNHPRALLAMMRLGEKEKTNKPANSRYTVGCWFDRAVRFQPEDGTVRMLYGTYLARKGDTKLAIEQLQQASELLGEEDGNAHYNLGLAYTELKQYDKALFHAHKAYALGFNLPGLRAKLERAGKWRDPAPPVANAPAATEVPGTADTGASSDSASSDVAKPDNAASPAPTTPTPTADGTPVEPTQ